MLTEFGEYVAKSEVNMEYLERIEPDIVQKINEKNRAEREKEIEKIKKKGGVRKVGNAYK